MTCFNTTKESGETPTTAFIDTILDLARHDSWFWQAYRPPCKCIPLYAAPGMHHAVKLQYGIDNLGEIRYDMIGEIRYDLARYDRPGLVHQTHVQMILNAPAIKDGTGCELRHLHDIVQQHLRALKALGYDPSCPFITSCSTRAETQHQYHVWMAKTQPRHIGCTSLLEAFGICKSLSTSIRSLSHWA